MQLLDTRPDTTIAAALGAPPFNLVPGGGAATRATLRTWLIRCGYHRRAVMSLDMATLKDAYADAGKLASLLGHGNVAEARLRGTAEATAEGYRPRRPSDVPSDTENENENGDDSGELPPPHKINGHDPAAQLAAAIRSIAASTASPLDESKVIDLIRKHAPQPTARTVEVRNVETGRAVNVGMAHRQFDTLLKACSARKADGTRVNVFLSGPAGSGKTTVAKQVAKALGVDFYFNGAIDSEYKLLGFTDAQGRVVSRPFRQAYQHGGVYLFDEVDGSLPSAVLAFNAALSNGHCDFPDGIIERHPDCVIIAAGNTWLGGATADYVGRFKQDAAFADRFAMLAWDYDEKLERETAADAAWCGRVQSLRAKARSLGMKVIISPRATYDGCALLAAGLDRDTVETMTLRKGMTVDQWRQLAAG